MNKELQNLIWAILPKEFREEVKKIYNREIGRNDYEAGVIPDTLVELFGHHNLTSDAEGEEMLYADKSKVQKIFAGQTEVQKSTPCGTILHHEAAAKAELLYTIFGSKCLSDEEPKAAEPKDKINLSQETVNCDKEFDNILKDNFREHNRLNVAAVAMAGILANPNLTNNCGYMEAYRGYIATQALYHADALIAECEKYHA